MTRPAPPDTERFVLDKKVPVVGIATLVLAVAIQCGTMIWIQSKQDSRIENLEKTVPSIAAAVQPLSDRVTKIETKVDQVVKDVGETKTDVKQILFGQLGRKQPPL